MPSRLKHTWLFTIYRKNKLLAAGAFIFFAGSITANLFQLETTPFFIWDMYKNPVYDKQEHDVYLVQYNNSRLVNFDNTWKEPRKLYLTSTLYYYMNYRLAGNKEAYRTYLEEHWAPKHPAFTWLLPHLYNTDEAFAAFPGWYQRYLSSIVGEEVKDVNIIKKKLRFREDMSLQEISSDTIKLIP